MQETQQSSAPYVSLQPLFGPRALLHIHLLLCNWLPCPCAKHMRMSDIPHLPCLLYLFTINCRRICVVPCQKYLNTLPLPCHTPVEGSLSELRPSCLRCQPAKPCTTSTDWDNNPRHRVATSFVLQNPVNVTDYDDEALCRLFVCCST